MKAEYKAGNKEDDLTLGKKYDVIDVKCKKGFEVSEVFLKNDKAQDRWYSVALFIMHAEATAAMRVAAAGMLQEAGMPAVQPIQAGVVNINFENYCGIIANHCGITADMVEGELKRTKRAAGLMFGA